MTKRDNTRSGGFGALESVNRRSNVFVSGAGSASRAQTDCPNCTNCGGWPLYYSGPCGPSSPVDFCGGGRPPEPVREGACTAMFVARSPINVAGGENVRFEMENGDTDDFDMRGESIILREGGLYSAEFTVSVPPGVEVSARAALTRDGDRMFATETDVVTDGSEIAGSFTGRGIFRAESGTRIAVNMRRRLEIDEPGETPAVVLTLARMQ